MPAVKPRRRALAIIVSAVVVAGLGVLGVTQAMAAEAGPITGSAANAWTSPEQTRPTVRPCSSGTATAPRRNAGPSTAPRSRRSASAWTWRPPPTRRARVQLYDCNGTGAQQWQARGSRLVNTGPASAWTRRRPHPDLGLHAARHHAAPTTTPPSTTGPKKGVSTWQFTGLSGAIQDVGAKWYYNWGTNNDAMPAGAEFVPMIWDENVVTAANLAKVKTEGRGDSVDYGLYRDATTPTEAGKAYRSAGG